MGEDREPGARVGSIGHPVPARLHVVVLVGTERFAFPAREVEEACDAPELSWAPGASTGFVGTLRHRERSVSAYDAGWILGVPREGRFDGALVVRHGVSCVALMVDDVEDLVPLEPRWVRRVPVGADTDGVLSGVYQVPGGPGGLVCIVRVSTLVSQIGARASGNQGSGS